MSMGLDNLGKRIALARAEEALFYGEYFTPDGSEVPGLTAVREYFENARRWSKFQQQGILRLSLTNDTYEALQSHREFKEIYSKIAGESPGITYRQMLNHSLKILRHPERATEKERESLAEFLSNYHDKIPNTSILDKLGAKSN